MADTNIILIAGYARNGKDTFADILISINPDKFVRVAFANALKAMLSDFIYDNFDGWDVYNLTDEQKKIVRPILIAVGCAFRELDKDFWVKKVYVQVHDIIAAGKVPVITDCRFISEYNFFKNIWGDNVILVEVSRNGAPPPPEEELKNHPQLQEKLDYAVKWDTVGDKNLHELRPFVEKFYQKYFN